MSKEKSNIKYFQNDQINSLHSYANNTFIVEQELADLQ